MKIPAILIGIGAFIGISTLISMFPNGNINVDKVAFGQHCYRAGSPQEQINAGSPPLRADGQLSQNIRELTVRSKLEPTQSLHSMQQLQPFGNPEQLGGV